LKPAQSMMMMMRDFEMQTSRDPPLVRNTIDAARSE